MTVGTVSRAYAEARRRGLIRGEVGRGTYVREREDVSLTPRGSAEATLVDLSVNVPAPGPAPSLREGLRALAERTSLDALADYREPAGSERARAAGAHWLSQFGVNVDATDVAVCAGSQHGIAVALASVVGPGELILAEALSYPGLRGAARLRGLRVAPVALDDEGVCPDALEAICSVEKPRLL